MPQHRQLSAILLTSLTLSNRHSFTVHPFIWINCITGQYDKARVMMNELK